MKIIIPVLTLFFITPIFGQIELMENKIVVTNEAKVNSAELEYSPAFFKSGIVFISTTYEKLWYRYSTYMRPKVFFHDN